NVDLFSFILTANHPGSGKLPNTVVVNIRPQWIFDNIMSLDNMSDSSGMVLVDKQGKLLQTDGMTSLPPAAVLRHLEQSMNLSESAAAKDFSIQKIDGHKYVISEMNVGV